MKRVAAILYFDEGTTAQDVKNTLAALSDYLDAKRVVKAKLPKNGVRIHSTTVGEYDPEIGSPVWYIP